MTVQKIYINIYLLPFHPLMFYLEIIVLKISIDFVEFCSRCYS